MKRQNPPRRQFNTVLPLKAFKRWQRTALAVAALSLVLGGTDNAQAQELKLLSADLPPYSMLNSDKTGFVAEVAVEIAKRIGQPTKLNYAPWSRVYRETQEQPNRVLAPIARTPQREDKFTWIVPVFQDRMVVLTYGDGASPMTLKEAAATGKLAVQQDSLIHELARKRGLTNLDVTPELKLIARKIAAGRATAWLSLESLAVFSLAEEGLDPDKLVVGETINEFLVTIAGSPTLKPSQVAPWREAFQAMKDDGTYGDIMAKYGF